MRLAIACILVFRALSFAQDTQTPTDARGWINQGVLAFKGQQYDRAIEAFQKAIDLEPGNVNAHLYLANALTRLYVSRTPEDINARAERAKSEFRRVLELDSSNMTALSALATSSLNEAHVIHDQEAKSRKLDDARDWFLKMIGVDPRNRDAYYSLGLIDWMKWHPSLVAARDRVGLKPEDVGPISDSGVRLDLKLRYGPVIEDGIANLNKALEIDPLYAEAMAYLDLLIRERANIRDSPEEYRSDIEEGEQWAQRARAARHKAQAAQGTPLPPAPVAIPGAPPTPSRIRVAGNVAAGNLITRVDPFYPPLAVQARVQGTVHFTVIIGKDGHVANIQLIGGHPLLVQAAQDAVWQWVYQRTDLNGVPVEVVTQVDVPFTLPDAR
jgi:tetratricopeptide (TPR) repeat protein